ncbi:enterochelin esterase-like enzyme [Roseimicrobium gellanilyticum]|uniref:Enterochelin esterase-like enzyme n=1 Tax=Roseimicrobium gellanilyticum TaxID=748857 RepID=A0A366H3I5_9BACT|nr:alpha/beta hydrolase-fold protein [Roseimicrobium gellanilyticum]RBP35635.1 enterochelin esterase-like enzyme [Roseimicrobium gellanilyticum]
MRHKTITIISALLCVLQLSAFAQSPRGMRRGGPEQSGSTPVLKPNQPEAPAGFDTPRSGAARGKVIPFEYESKTAGGTFRATIYAPPGFSPGKKYPVLFLLHGASGDENNWVQAIHADAILDNLYADKRLVPMLVVMPSSISVAGRQQAAESRDAKARASMTFGEVLLNDLLPYVESKFPALTGRENRALAGLSMGAGAALSTGTANSDKFAWVGAFSGAGRRWTEPNEKLRLLWLSVGDRDSMMGAGMVAADAFFTEKNIPHVFRINAGGHEPKVWMNDLYHFAPLLFQP